MNKHFVAAEECAALASRLKLFEAYMSRETHLGGLRITRALPVKDKRLVGPWCFLDRYGPLSFSAAKPMDVAPHPHIGLQYPGYLREKFFIMTASVTKPRLEAPSLNRLARPNPAS
jgi:hypothetical protein